MGHNIFKILKNLYKDDCNRDDVTRIFVFSVSHMWNITKTSSGRSVKTIVNYLLESHSRLLSLKQLPTKQINLIITLKSVYNF